MFAVFINCSTYAFDCTIIKCPIKIAGHKTCYINLLRQLFTCVMIIYGLNNFITIVHTLNQFCNIRSATSFGDE